jgi:hypothetical protein
MKHLQLLVSSIVTLLMVAPSWSYDVLYCKESLKGIKSIGVLVSTQGDDVINKSDIQTDVELKLRMAGIKVVDLNAASAEKSAPDALFYISISLQRLEQLGKFFKSVPYNFLLSFSLRQSVTVTRNPDSSCMSPTWMYNFYGTGVKDVVANAIKDTIRGDIFDQFLKDYRAANPNQAGNP